MATAHRWWVRWREATAADRASLACLHDRSSRPRTSPTMLCAAEQERICQVRERTGWGPRLIAGEVGQLLVLQRAGGGQIKRDFASVA